MLVVGTIDLNLIIQNFYHTRIKKAFVGNEKGITMATIRAYTTIEQSKKLAEILSNETSDMYYWCGESIRFGGYKAQDKDYDVPCWSLAALINILPDKVVIDGRRWGLKKKKKRISYLGRMTFDGQLHISVEGDNLLDACVKMILHLKGRNLI